MSDETTVGLPPPAPGDPPTRDPAPSRTASEPTADLTNAKASSSASASSPAMPDLSMAPGISAPGFRAKPEPPRLDGYNVTDAIGEGGMGTVWRAVQLSTRRHVALKLMSAAGFASERARQRFDREVEITARLEHPNIARVYDSGLNRGVYFYAMELIDGTTLDQFVTRKHLSRREILQLFAIVCRGVEHAHERGVIHRDLKPGNILVTPDGQPHVLDFGLAKALLQAGKEAGISLDGEIAGTPGYMSPEQAAGKLDIDARCDVYSLGVILYRLLTGDTPHDLSGSYLDILRRVSDEEPKRPRVADKTIDVELEALLLCAIQREPAHRYKTAGELAQDIENYLAGDPISATPPTTIYFLRKRVRKHRVKLATVGVVVLLAGLAIALTGRLIHSHRLALEETRKKKLDIASAVAPEEKAKEIARGNSDVLAGDKAFAAAAWTDAAREYQSAISHFEKAGASAMRAEIGLWDVARTAPAPLTIISPATTGAAFTSELTARPVISHDGRRAVAGYQDGTIRMFDLATGRLLQTIPAEKGAVRSVAVSNDGTFAITGGDQGSVKIWDLPSGRLRTSFSNAAAPLKNRVTHVAISPDGLHAISASGMTPDALNSPTYNDTMTLWDVAAARALLSSDVQAGVFSVKKTVTQIAFSPDSTRVATGSAAVDVWNVSDGRRLTGIPNSATAVAFSGDGSRVLAGSFDGAIRVLDVATGSISAPQQHGSAIRAIGTPATSDEVVTISEDGAFRGISSQGVELWAQPPRGDIDAAALSDDAHLAMTAAEDGLSVWRMSPARAENNIAAGGPYPNVAISSDARLALVRSARRGSVHGVAADAALFDIATGKELDTSGLPLAHCDALAMSRAGRTIAIVSGSGLAVWSLDPPHEIARFSIKRQTTDIGTSIVAISADGTNVAVSGGGSLMSVYRVIDPSKALCAIAEKSNITSASFSADGRTLLLGLEDQAADAWNVETGTLLASLRGHEASVNAVAISDDGKYAVTGSGAPKFASGNDNSVRVWSLPSGQLLSTFTQHTARVRAVAISGDGQLIASGGDDQTVVLHDRAANEVLRTLPGRHGAILSLCFDMSGKSLGIGADTVSIWDFARPARQRELEDALIPLRENTAARPLDGVSLLALGRWYAFHGEMDWAASLFRDASAVGSQPAPLESWQADWLTGNLPGAIRELNSVSAQDAPAYYVKLCEATVRAESRKQTGSGK